MVNEVKFGSYTLNNDERVVLKTALSHYYDYLKDNSRLGDYKSVCYFLLVKLL